jgi:peptidoglycan hydrolase CwlO-like protein
VNRRFFVYAAFAVLALSLVAESAFAEEASQAVSDRQRALQAELDRLEQEIRAQQSLLDNARGERQTLQSQIDAYNAQIKKTQLQIQAIDLSIQKLSGDIGTRNKTLGELSDRLDAERESLAHILRQTQILEDYSIVAVALSSKGVSDFFSDLDAFASIKTSLADSFADIRETSASTQVEKEALEGRLAEQEKLRTVAQLAKQSVQTEENAKQKLLTQTKGVESNYQKLISANQKSAAQIRAALFELRDSAAIPFGTALQYAELAERATGVRPAVTLAVLKQETNLGENLGTGTWRVDMNPTRDQPVFPYIAQELGLDPNSMPVSKRPGYGWGGAMGPGQFIPSTWVCYGGFVNTVTGGCTPSGGLGSAFWQGPWEYRADRDRVRKLTGGSSASNPWSARDAIMATAMFMADNGADAGTRAAERLAALRYFAGWGGASNPAYAFYGDGVMGFADDFQAQVDILKGS